MAATALGVMAVTSLYLCLDVATDAVIWVSKDLGCIQTLKQGLLDSELTVISEDHPVYPMFKDWLPQQRLWINRQNQVQTVPDQLQTQRLDERYQWARLRWPLICLLRDLTEAALAPLGGQPLPELQATLLWTLGHGETPSGGWPAQLETWAAICEQTASEAAREIAWELENLRARQSRVLAWYRRFQSEISEVRDPGQAEALRQRLWDRLLRDTWL